MNNKNEQGYSLIGVLLIITIVAIVGTSLAGITLQSVKTSTKERDNQAVYYIAEAGMNHLTMKFQEAVLSAYHDETVKNESDFNQKLNDLELPEMWDEFENVSGEQVFANFDMNKVNETNYELTSTGYIGSETRTVSRIVEVNWEEKYQDEEETEYKLPPFAVFTSGQFSMSNGKIIGDIGTIQDQNGAISFPSGGPTLEGDIYVPNGSSNIVNNKVSKITAEVKEIDPSYSIPSLPLFPKTPTYECPEDETIEFRKGASHSVIKICNFDYTNWDFVNSMDYHYELNKSVKFNSFKMLNGMNLTIDVKDSDKALVVNDFNIGGEIKLIGDGTLTLYVNNTIIMTGGSKLNQKEFIEKLNIYYKGEKLNLAGEQKIYGSLYARKANLDLTGSGGIYGNIFSGGKEIKMSGGSEIEAQLILAPNAKVTMSGGGSVKGMIMSKEYNQSGGATVELKEPFVLTGPIS